MFIMKGSKSYKREERTVEPFWKNIFVYNGYIHRREDYFIGQQDYYLYKMKIN